MPATATPPSALWSWQVTPAGAGCELTVTWAVYPRPWGADQRGPVRTSLAGLDAHLQPSKAGALGHMPAAQAGSEFVMLSPQEELAVSEAALKANMQRLMQGT